MICLLLGTSTMVMASGIDDTKLTKAEAIELITEIKQDFNLCDTEKVKFQLDDDGNLESGLIKVIKIYDKNNDLLLEAPIHTLEQMANKQLRTIVNASDFLAESNNVFLYRLDL